jgi:hypothetical protein
MSHLWQRFVLALTLLFGLAVGVAATVFGYSNTQTVDVKFSVFHLNGVPLWAVGLVPVALVIAAGTLYHWWNSLHHFTEHMRHRRRVRELEAEVASLKSHLDKFLEMPDGTVTVAASPAVTDVAAPMPALAETEVVAMPEAADETAAGNGNGNGNGSAKASRKKDKKVAGAGTDSVASDPAGDAGSADAKVEDEMASPFAPTTGS